MAILVFTGYKLASPDVVRRIFDVGREQLIIFLVTRIATLQIGLISGIALGTFSTFVIHVLVNKNFALFFRNVLKPNVLMYKEDIGKGNFYVSVKHFCSFLNYYKLKDKLDAIPEDQDVIVDFSLCQFVDDTVMENLTNYQDLFHKRGGHFDIIGLDMHGADSAHPYALRRILPIPTLFSNLTRRQNHLEEMAAEFELSYSAEKEKSIDFLNSFRFFKTKSINHIYNKLSGNKGTVTIFDIEFSEGEFIAKEVVRSTMMHIELARPIPEFTLDREGFLERFYSLAGFRDIPIAGHSDFSRRFYLLGEDEGAIREFFNIDLIHFFESNPYYHVKSDGKSLLLFGRERLAGIKEIKALLDFGIRLKTVVQKSSA